VKTAEEVQRAPRVRDEGAGNVTFPRAFYRELHASARPSDRLIRVPEFHLAIAGSNSGTRVLSIVSQGTHKEA
jgi:hypothetical protein